MEKQYYMKRYNKTYENLAAQIVISLVVLLAPSLITLLVSFDTVAAAESFKATLICAGPTILLFFLDYYLLVGQLLFKGRTSLFVLINCVLLLSTVIGALVYFRILQLPTNVMLVACLGMSIYLIIGIVMVTYVVGARGYMKWQNLNAQYEAEKQRNTEAELAWLKNQLNPHFLFNTLNNISSLIQIDADSAQDSISQLSDLLRYALYESNKPTVPLKSEVDFMDNYIDLMKLRCNEMSTVTTDFRLPDTPMEIVPLLFISIIENAFKHGISAREKSFVDIRMRTEGDSIIFTCDNSNYPKTDKNRSGSGVGLENMKRRLELLYPKRYSYTHELRDNNVYHVEIILKGCTPKTEDKKDGQD